MWGPGDHPASNHHFQIAPSLFILTYFSNVFMTHLCDSREHPERDERPEKWTGLQLFTNYHCIQYISYGPSQLEGLNFKQGSPTVWTTM